MKRALELDKAVSSGYITSYMELIKYLVVFNTGGITVSAGIPSVLRQVNGVETQSYLSMAFNFMGAAVFMVGLFFSGMCWMSGLIYFEKLGYTSRKHISLLALRTSDVPHEKVFYSIRLAHKMSRSVRRSEKDSSKTRDELKFHLKYAFISVIIGSSFVYASVIDNTKTINDYVECGRVLILIVHISLNFIYSTVCEFIRPLWLSVMG